MLPSRTGKCIARNQDKLAAALLGLMQDTDYDAITVSALCRAAGVSRNTFYRNFSGKGAVLDYAMDDICLQYQFDEAGYRRAGNSVAHFLEFFRAHPDYFDAFRKTGMTLFLLRSTSQYAYREARQAAPGVPQDQMYWVSSFLAAGLLNLYEHWRAEGFQTPAAEIAQAVLAYVPVLKGPGVLRP